MEFAVLGPLLVQGDNGPIDIAGAKERTLLAHLVSRAGQMVSTDALVDSLWGEEPPRTAAKSLQTYVLRLRNMLEPERNGSPRLLVTEGRGYRLAVGDEAVDAWRFGRLVELGQRAYRDGRADSASATFGEALALWRGPAYSEFEWTTFGGSEARRLEELRLVAVEDRITAELDLGRAREAVPELESLTHQHPLRERLWSLLVLALYRAGRQSDALAAYGNARAVLVDELGVEPGDDLRQLHARVLAHDAGLVAPRPEGSVPATLTPPTGAFVGRDAEIAYLRAAWSRALVGQAVTVFIRGRKGSGVRRLAGEFAVEIAEQGGAVEHVTSESAVSDVVADPSSGPSLLVLSEFALARLSPPTRPGLVLVLAGPTADVPAWAERVDLGALSDADVATVLREYLPDSAVGDALPLVMRESGGLPGRVHDAALGFVRQRATARVGAAAQRADETQQAFGAARHDLRGTVVELGEVQDRMTALPAGVCPWKGLVAYDVEDAPWFSGRERLIAELLVRIASARLVAVVGASGSGKSSLVRAGLVASLEAGSLPGSETWVRLVMRPGPHPMRELARIALRGTEPARDRDHVADLLERLVYGSEAGGRLVLVIDQLEELWTTCSDATERAAFLDTVAELLDSATPCNVVLVVRADYVAELADHPILAAAMADATVLVGAPSQAEVRRAVERPAELAGVSLERGLTDAIVDDAGDEPGSLPLLSTAMTELWDRRIGNQLTLSSYVTAGGIDGAVTRIAERVYGGLTDADQRAARLLLLRLAGPGDGDATARQRVRLDDLAALPDGRVRAVVDPLADARLLSVSADQVEVAHEALFREWPRLRGWLDEDAAGRAVQRRLAVAAREWDANQRDPTDLWRGARLDSGLEFAARHPDELTETERAFLDAGQAEHDAELVAAQESAAATSRQNRRLKWLLGGLGVVLVSAIVAGSLAITASARAERETRAATARELSAAALANLDADPELSMLLALEAIDQTRSPDGIVLPEAEEALHQAVGASRVVLNVPDIGGSVAWSPNDVFVTEGPENSGIIDLRDAATGESVRAWPGHKIDVNDVAFSSDGSMLATSGDDGAVRVWDPRNGQQVAQLLAAPDTQVWHPTFSPDGSLVAATWLDPDGGGGGFVAVLDVTTGEQEARFGPFDVVGASAFDPVGSRLAISAFTNAETELVASPRVTPFVLPDLERIGSTAWSPDGSRIATRGAGTALAIRNAETGAVIFQLNGHTGNITDIEWSADSTSLVTSSEDKTVRVWDLNDGAAAERLVLSGSGTANGAQGVALSPDASRVMAGDLDIQSVTIWDITDTGNAEIANLPGTPDNPTAASFTPDGHILANRGGGSVTEWDPASGAAVRSLEVDFDAMDVSDNAYMEEVTVSPDGDLVAYAVDDVVSVRDARTDAEIVRRSSGWFVLDLDWSPADEKLAVSTADGLTVVVDRDGQQLATLNAGDGYMAFASNFSPDGRLLAVATQLLDVAQPQDSRIQVWDWQAGDIVTTIQVDADDVEFDPTGTLLVSGGSFEPAGIWRVPSGEKVRTLTGVGGGIGDFAISPDGSTIAGGRYDGAISIWDTDTGSQRLVLTGHQDVVINVEISPDGASLLSSGFDGVVRVWAIDLDDLIAIAHNELTRGFTDDECRQYLQQEGCEAS